LILEPVLLLVHDPRARDCVEAELRKRYAADYQVITTESVQATLGVLGQLRDDRRQVSLVLADQWLPEATGTELLARVRQLHPAARRVLLITWGDQTIAEPILRATVLGDIDAYVVKPGTPPDEHFHRFVTEQLDEWGRSNLPGLETVRVVGEEWAARSHELRELLGRNGIPFGFYPAAAHVTVLVRGRSLADSMSDYLIRAIESAPNIAVRYGVAVTGGTGQSRLESLTLTDLESGAAETVNAVALFVLIGAEPRTQWLPDAVRRDQSGFVVTGTDLLQGGQPDEQWPLRRLPMFLESSLPGVFAVGDVRHGSVKRVAAAVGEGSTAIRLVHDHLRGNGRGTDAETGNR